MNKMLLKIVWNSGSKSFIETLYMYVGKAHLHYLDPEAQFLIEENTQEGYPKTLMKTVIDFKDTSSISINGKIIYKDKK